MNLRLHRALFNRHYINMNNLINYNKYSFCTKPDEYSNVSSKITDSIGLNIYKNKNHPLGILTELIKDFFADENKLKSKDLNLDKIQQFKIFNDFSPIVDVKDCFKDLLVEDNHETLSPKNTYYINKNNVLRTHMTTHDVSLLRKGEEAFILIGDVYRRDTIDSTHFPIFHQVDGVRVYNSTPKEKVFEELKYCLEQLIKTIIKSDIQMRWVDAYFPFTEPSAELEIYYEGQWLEILGCGVFRDGVLKNAGLDPQQKTAWAFGLGLERLAMTLFNIKDIRLFWTKDKRFLKQFKEGQIIKFKSYSKFPPCFKDFTFFVNSSFQETDFHELVRHIAGDIAEEVKLIDKYIKNGRESHCYRINFRHMDKSLTNEEINLLQSKIREEIVNTLKLELR